MPWTPSATATRDARGVVTVAIDAPEHAQRLTYRVLRDGRQVASGLTTRAWRDPAPARPAATLCYSAEAVHVATHLASQPSAPSCVRGTVAQTIPVTDARVRGAELLAAGDSVALPTRRLALGTRLTVTDVVVTTPGDYAVAARYDNHVFALNTGVTDAVKRLTVTDAAGVRHEAVLDMPHVRPVDGVHPIRESTRAFMHLAPGRYTLELSDFFNMSELAANAAYTGPGGKDGPINEARVAAITLDLLGKN
jgi:hypothetical protein